MAFQTNNSDLLLEYKEFIRLSRLKNKALSKKLNLEASSKNEDEKAAHREIILLQTIEIKGKLNKIKEKIEKSTKF